MAGTPPHPRQALWQAPRSTARRGAALSRLVSPLSCLVALAGCSSFQTFGLPTDPAHAIGNYQEKHALSIAAQLLTDPESVKHHFGPDLRKAGYLPVLIFVENRGESSFEIQRKSFSVILESGERFEPAPPLEVYSKIRRSTLPALVLAPLIFPAILLHQHIEDYNFQAARTLHEKCFPQSLRLEKGDLPQAHAVFFRDRGGGDRPARSFDSSVLQVIVEIEGARPAAAGASISRPGDPSQPAPAAAAAQAAPTGQAAAAASPGPNRQRDEGYVVGKLLTFTVSLTPEDS